MSANSSPKPFFLNTVNDPEPTAIPAEAPVPPTARRVYTESILTCHQYDASHLIELMLLISGNKLTGSLTINYAQGTVAGTVEWKERK